MSVLLQRYQTYDTAVAWQDQSFNSQLPPCESDGMGACTGRMSWAFRTVVPCAVSPPFGARLSSCLHVKKTTPRWQTTKHHDVIPSGFIVLLAKLNALVIASSLRMASGSVLSDLSSQIDVLKFSANGGSNVKWLRLVKVSGELRLRV